MKTTETRIRRPLPSVWDYADYRLFLEAHLDARRSQPQGFSVHQFCVKAGVSTRNYASKVIRGEKRLGPKLGEAFARATGLDGAEVDYFRALVDLELARNAESKELILSRLEGLRRKFRRGVPVTDHSILRHWYFGAIWELGSCAGFDVTPEAVVRALDRKISMQEAKEAIAFLKAKGYLVERDGKLVQSDVPIQTRDGQPDPLVQINHRETLARAIDAVDLPVDERGLYGMTLAVDQRRLPELRARLKACMDQIQSEFSMDPSADTVYRIQAQVFPMAAVEN